MKLFSSLVVFSFFSTALVAQDKSQCVFSAPKEEVKVQWTAFKTAKKVAVPGSFTQVEFESKGESKNVEQLLQATSFKIDLTTVASGDPIRDGQLRSSFFKLLKQEGVASGNFIKARAGKVQMVLTMNGVRKSVPMNYTVKDDLLEAKGSLNLFDFAAEAPFKTLAQACLVKHEGKSWPEVDLLLTAKLAKTCR